MFLCVSLRLNDSGIEQDRNFHLQKTGIKEFKLVRIIWILLCKAKEIKIQSLRSLDMTGTYL